MSSKCGASVAVHDSRTGRRAEPTSGFGKKGSPARCRFHFSVFFFFSSFFLVLFLSSSVFLVRFLLFVPFLSVSFIFLCYFPFLSIYICFAVFRVPMVSVILSFRSLLFSSVFFPLFFFRYLPFSSVSFLFRYLPFLSFFVVFRFSFFVVFRVSPFSSV